MPFRDKRVSTRTILSGATFIAKNYFPSAGTEKERFRTFPKSRPILLPGRNIGRGFPKGPPESRVKLMERLRMLGRNGESLPDALEEYIRNGGVVRRRDLIWCVRDFRKFYRHDRALEIFDWMEKIGRYDFSSTDHAIRLNLVAIVRGISAAQDYFDNLPMLGKNLKTYNVLFHSYVQHWVKDKALALFEKMEGLNLINPMTFGNLMDLYLKLDQPGMVRTLVDRMKRRGLPLNALCYKFWMRSCARLNDIDGVEFVFRELSGGNERHWHWTHHTELASIFVKARQFKKAEKPLLDVLGMRPKDRGAYHILINLYAKMRHSDGVSRVWHHVRRSYRLTNTSYLVMIRAMAKLKDADKMKECFDQWKSFYSVYDRRITTMVIYFYLRWNRVGDAGREFEEALERSPKRMNTARSIFVSFYLRKKRDAAMAMRYANEERNMWGGFRPKRGVLKAFFNCLQRTRDVERAEELCRKLKKEGLLSADVYNGLIMVYISAGRVAAEMRGRIEEDGIEVTPELEKSLDMVCP